MSLSSERLDFLIAHYVSGSLPEPARALVGAHLEMRASAAGFARTLEEMAGDALHDGESLAVSARDRRLKEIFRSAPMPSGPRGIGAASKFPASLRAYVGVDLPDIPWKLSLPGLRRHVLEKSSEVEASLLWARPGRAFPRHRHRGLELTLVLEGEFHDQQGRFRKGDVAIADETVQHRPVAGKRGPCICFLVLFAPIALSGSPFRLIGDIIGI
ncbi:cupin domain-containing protein [Neorhizobium petrolearium]|uniref:cupin domain-containing protein n=1 Tax=Neorhizobium petrolearium TaxID=515361 RepID=UPI003F15CF77